MLTIGERVEQKCLKTSAHPSPAPGHLKNVLTFFSSELDTEGTITPDEEGTQEMGDSSMEVTEEMTEKANEERAQGSMAMAEGEAC